MPVWWLLGGKPKDRYTRRRKDCDCEWRGKVHIFSSTDSRRKDCSSFSSSHYSLSSLESQSTLPSKRSFWLGTSLPKPQPTSFNSPFFDQLKLSRNVTFSRVLGSCFNLLLLRIIIPYSHSSNQGNRVSRLIVTKNLTLPLDLQISTLLAIKHHPGSLYKQVDRPPAHLCHLSI